MTLLEIACLLAGLAGLGGWITYHLAISQELAAARHETSRFPMFAARDELVSLAVCGRISEDDGGWRSLYDSVTFMLGIDRKLHVLDITSKYIHYLVMLEENPKLRSQIDKSLALEEYAARRVPEFASAREQVRRAFDHLIQRRTTRSHKMALVGLYVGVLLVKTALQAGPSTAKNVSRAVKDRTYDSLIGWPLVERLPA